MSSSCRFHISLVDYVFWVEISGGCGCRRRGLMDGVMR
jgi:hypothetical protein